MGFSDLLLLVWGTVCLFLPGASVLVALRRISLVSAVASAPAVTIGLLYVAALVGGVTTLPYGIVLAGVVWLVALAGALALGRDRPWRDVLGTVRPSLVHVVGALAALAAVGLATLTWVHGLGGLKTPPQEHDTIVHTELVAYVMHTGHAAPWQSFPADFLTGSPSGFYPNGFHLYAAIVGALGAGPVNALNAAMVVLFAVAMPLGTAALGLLLRPRAVAPLIGGTAALLATVAYRPLVSLMHDGGILSNAASFAVAPGTVVLVLLAGRLGRPGILPVGLAVAGAVVVHPTSMATIGITAGLWLLAATLPSAEGRRRLRRELAVLAMAAGAAAVALIPFLLAAIGVTTSASTSATGVASFPRDIDVMNLRSALGTVLAVPYGGYYDSSFNLAQSKIALLVIAGIVLCVYLRLNAGLTVVFAAWAAVLMGFLMNVHLAPLRMVAGIYYNSYPRISGALGLAQWLMGGVAVGVAVDVVARLARRVPIDRWRPQVSSFVAPVLGALAALALVALVCLPYARVNTSVIASRYRTPDFTRVDGDDLAAGAFVAKRIGPGDRVMNNANDGSSFDYVYYRLPIVVNTSLGSSNAPYTTDLLRAFDELNTDSKIRDEVCRLHITWVVVDDDAPSIGAFNKSWLPQHSFTVAPGLQNLATVPHVTQAARFGHVSVFTVDLAALGCPTAPAS